MATIPQDIQASMKKLSESKKVPIKELVGRLKQIMDTDENIQTMEKDDFKIRYAWAILYREHALTGNAVECYFSPVCHADPREIEIKGEKTFVGDITGLVQKIEKDEDGNITTGEWNYAHGTFWRDGAKNLKNLSTDKVYKCAITIKENSWGYTISGDKTTFSPTEEKVPPFSKFYEEEIKPRDIVIGLGEADLNKSETPTDIKVVEVTVMDAQVGERDGREFGRYAIMDDSISGSTVTVFVDPRDVKYELGSRVLMGMDISFKKDETPRYNIQFQLPTDMSAPKTFEEKQASENKQEEIDIDLDEEEPQESEEKEEKSSDEVAFEV